MSDLRTSCASQLQQWFKAALEADDKDLFLEAKLVDSWGYPPALAKACCDLFDYACRLRTGEVLRFDYAHAVTPKIVNLSHPDNDFSGCLGRIMLPCPRGIDVRVEDIVWIADAAGGE